MIINWFQSQAVKLLGGLSLALLIGGGVLWFLWQSADARADRLSDQVAALEGTVLNLELDRAIAEQAAIERAQDKSTLTTQEKELSDARTVPGDSPADRHLRRLCVLRIQQSGRDGLPSQCSRLNL